VEIDYFLITALRKMQALSLNVDTSFKIEKHILVDEFDDPEFLEFAIENYSEMLNSSRKFCRKSSYLFSNISSRLLSFRRNLHIK
jgi:hypothetical protein